MLLMISCGMLIGQWVHLKVDQRSLGTFDFKKSSNTPPKNSRGREADTKSMKTDTFEEISYGFLNTMYRVYSTLKDTYFILIYRLAVFPSTSMPLLSRPSAACDLEIWNKKIQIVTKSLKFSFIVIRNWVEFEANWMDFYATLEYLP